MSTAPEQPVSLDLAALSRETGVSVDVLRTLAGISDPANEHLLTAQSLGAALAVRSMSRMVASAKALQEQNQLLPVPVPPGVKRPAVRGLRVKPE